MSYQDRSIRRIVTAGVLLAITLLLVFTRIGMIPVPTPAGNATIAHIPAIVGGILEGPLVGLLIGLGFGFASFSTATIPMFKDPLVAVLPRVFIGITAYAVFFGLRKANKTTLNVLLGVLALLMLLFAWEVAKTTLWAGILAAALAIAAALGIFFWMQKEDVRIVSLAIAAAVGSLTNTALVLGAAVWRGYIPGPAAWGIALTHGIPEVIVSAIVTVAVVAAMRQISGKRKGSRL
jgi:uncharacterized membrane protein